MLTNSERNALSDAFSGHVPSVAISFCLNARHKEANCTRCASCCPAEAITLKTGHPELDTDRCVACGACEAVCPTDVFTQTVLPETKLAKTAAQLAAHSIVIVCPLHQTPDHTTTPAEAVIRHERCLAALTASDLLALCRNGQRAVWLDDSPCTGCAIGAVHNEIALNVATADALLRSAGQPVALHLATEQQDHDSAERHKLQVFDGAQPKLSRRGLFGALRQATADKVDATADQTNKALQSANSIPVNERLPQRMPPSRMNLLQQLAMSPAQENRIALPEQAPFAEIVINSQFCSACELCARFCPTGALQFSQTGDTFEIGFRVSACIGCDICAVACPDNAMDMEDLTQPAWLLTDQRRSLAQGMLAACNRCGVPTAVRENDETPILCYACRGVGGIRPRPEGADLIDDLLKRLPGG